MKTTERRELMEEFIKSLTPEQLLQDRNILVNEDGYTHQLLHKDSLKVNQEYKNITRLFIHKDKTYIEYELDDFLKSTGRVIISGSDYYNEAKKLMNGVEFKDVKKFLNEYANKKDLELKITGITFAFKSKTKHMAPQHRFWFQRFEGTSIFQDLTVKHHKKDFNNITNHYLSRAMGELLWAMKLKQAFLIY